MLTYSVFVGRDGLDALYLEAWLLGNTDGYRRKGSIIYVDLSPEQAHDLRNEGWSVRPL